MVLTCEGRVFCASFVGFCEGRVNMRSVLAIPLVHICQDLICDILRTTLCIDNLRNLELLLKRSMFADYPVPAIKEASISCNKEVVVKRGNGDDSITGYV